MSQIVNCYVAKLNQPRSPRSLNLRYFNFGLMAMIASLGVFYLINISNLTVQGFALQDLKKQAANLASEQTVNQEEVDSIQSYYTLSERTKGLNMVALGEVEYLSVIRPVVAKK